MPTFVCVTCGGTYTDPLPDGTAYFHSCPPVVNVVTGVASPRDGHRDENVRGGIGLDAHAPRAGSRRGQPVDDNGS